MRIRVEALTRTYGDRTAVDQVSFEIGRGEIVGLLGRNGAGKTTIMKMLTGCLEPTGGSIEIDGMEAVVLFAAGTDIPIKVVRTISKTDLKKHAQKTGLLDGPGWRMVPGTDEFFVQGGQ